MIGAPAVVLLRSLPLGTRVVIRHRLPDGSATDALGDLSAVDEISFTVVTRRGSDVVDHRNVIAAKTVPPAPPRRGRRSSLS